MRIHMLSRLIALSALLHTACRISDARVDEEIKRRGGTIISPADASSPPTKLAGEFPQTVSQGGALLAPPSIQISSAAVPACQDACWETVSREYLDGEPVMDPGTHPANGQDAIGRELNKRAVNGYVPDVTAANPAGRGKDGACDATKRGPSSYQDAPHVRDEDFDVGGSFRVYVLEQETCMRCLKPPSDYLLALALSDADGPQLMSLGLRSDATAGQGSMRYVSSALNQMA